MKLFYKFGMAAAIGAPLLLSMYRNAFQEKLKKANVELVSRKPFKPFKLLFIADIHRRKLESEMFDFHTDLIIIGGDLTERGVPMKRVAENMKILTGIAPVYFVWGNNDREVDEITLRKLLAHFGAEILEDESVELFGYSHLKLVGIDYFNLRENKLEKAFSNVEEDDTVIFVCHTPSIFKYVRKNHPVNFLLAGHTHGGQIRLGKLGLYKKGAMTVKNGKLELVSNGFGTTSLPLRLGAEAEYHLFTIRPAVEYGSSGLPKTKRILYPD